MDEDELLERADAFAKEHDRTTGERLGFGIHGIVVVLNSESKVAPSALKILASPGPYRRERDTYLRLQQEQVTKVRGFRVPQLLAWDDDLLAVEMTVVAPPHVLDFASAYLDFPPEFPEESWEDWQTKERRTIQRRLARGAGHSCRTHRVGYLHARSFSGEYPFSVIRFFRHCRKGKRNHRR